MKRRQIVAMLSCLIVGLAGFAGAYTTEKAKNDKTQNQLEAKLSTVAETEKIFQTSSVIEPETEEERRGAESENKKAVSESAVKEEPKKEPEKKQPEKVETVKEDTTLHFRPQDGLRWPVEGEVVLDYSMDHTIYFPTLEQFQYNPALIIGSDVNEKVYVIAKGTITNISTNEETGCTVRQDLGDGYTAIYGQLKETNFQVGESIERGQVIGHISEPTKYYSAEGSNLYFAMEKDGKPINPLDYFE